MHCLQHQRIQRLLITLPLVVGLTFTSFTEVSAFDWEGRLERELKGLHSPAAMTRRWAVLRLSRFPANQVKQHILEALRDGSAVVQLAAAETAAQLRIQEATPILTRWLSHWDNQLREAAAQYLAPIGGPKVTQTLLRSLVDPEPKVRRQIITALGALADRRAVLPIIARLDDPNIEVRTSAVQVLAAFLDRRAVIPLMARLSDPSSRIRQAVVLALAELGDPRSAPAITRLLRDPNEKVVRVALDALGKLRYPGAVEPMIEIFQTGHKRYRGRAAGALATLGTDLAMSTLLKALSRPNLRTAAKAALSAATQQKPEHLNGLLSDPRTPRHVALIAVEIARNTRLRAAVPHLIEELRRGRLPQLLIVEALGRIGDPRAQRPLLGLLSEAEPELKLATLKALKPTLDPRAAEPLLACLRDHSSELRQITISYLGELRAKVATAPLSRIAKQATGAEANAATAALARIADPRSIPTLIKLLGHRSNRIRRLVVVAFGRIKVPSGNIDALVRVCKRRGGRARVSCIHALGAALRGRSHSGALAYLSNTLKLQTPNVVLATLDALAAQRHASIAPLLLNRLPKVHSPLIKAGLVSVLGTHASGSQRALPVLLALLHDTDGRVAAAAAWALAKLRIPAAARGLAKATQSPHWATRVNASAALALVRVSSHRALLRGLLEHRDPYIRANALLGLLWLGDTSIEPIALRLVQRDQSPWVRSNALRVLLQYQTTPVRLPSGLNFSNSRVLATELARSDADTRLRHIAKTLLTPPSSAPTHRWVQIYLQDRQGRPLRNKPYVLILSSGLIKADHGGPRSLVWEEDIPPGEVFLELAPAQLLKPGRRANLHRAR
ncbi:MAG: HEAT repeat domain-containing protein [Deltaproteobacteria bacterium]|nr:HEAT repeat domain-containing protein [Deltaproteobacteria bacterium]